MGKEPQLFQKVMLSVILYLLIIKRKWQRGWSSLRPVLEQATMVGHAYIASYRIGSRTDLSVGFASGGQEAREVPSCGFAKPAQAE
jgi:hypothetical protein